MGGSATFDFLSDPDDGDCVVHVQGDLDAQGLSGLRHILSEAITGRPDEVVLNLADVRYFNASALAIVLAEPRQQGLAIEVRLLLQAQRETLRSLLHMPGMDLMLQVAPLVNRPADHPRRPFPSR